MTAQPLIALAEAQAVRSERAALKRRLAATRPRAPPSVPAWPYWPAPPRASRG